MNSNTRLAISISNFIVIIQNKFLTKKANFSTKLFLLFMGFVIGSLFGTFLSNFPEKINSHSVNIVLIISSIEVTNCLVYSSKQRHSLLGLLLETAYQFLILLKIKFYLVFKSISQKEKIRNNLLSEKKKNYFYRDINSFKIGIMLGFFIDAFKVGS